MAPTPLRPERRSDRDRRFSASTTDQASFQVKVFVVTEQLWSEYEAFATRDLSEHEIVYLYLDGVAERLHPGQKKDAVLCGWGIDLDGHKHLLARAGHQGRQLVRDRVPAGLRTRRRTTIATRVHAITPVEAGSGTVTSRYTNR